MAKITQITVECTYTKALPNYENVKPMAGVVIQIEDGDDVHEEYKKA